MATSSDDPALIRAMQERISASLGKEDQIVCGECDAPLMRVYSVYGGWLWLAVYGQGDVPAAQCPKVPGLYDIGNGAHRPTNG
ncbi:hypothetical protein [Nonomuraea sp. NPDC003754]